MRKSENLEQDYERWVTDISHTRFLPGSSVEIIREISRRDPPSHVLFDFDGTLSLIREGWQRVMIPMMVEVLIATGTDESEEELTGIVHDFVNSLTGKQTIYQMIQLSEEVKKRGGTPEDPLVYKSFYLERLMKQIHERREGLNSGRINPEDMLVPYSNEFLEALKNRGVKFYLASGTDKKYVIEEAKLLGLDRYFGNHIYGAVDEYQTYSKKLVIDYILEVNKVEGTKLLGFGDGYVEIDDVKSVGGIAVAVASDEAGRSGRPDAWKRDRLISIGADVVIPDYRDYTVLLSYLWDKS